MAIGDRRCFARSRIAKVFTQLLCIFLKAREHVGTLPFMKQCWNRPRLYSYCSLCWRVFFEALFYASKTVFSSSFLRFCCARHLQTFDDLPCKTPPGKVWCGSLFPFAHWLTIHKNNELLGLELRDGIMVIEQLEFLMKLADETDLHILCKSIDLIMFSSLGWSSPCCLWAHFWKLHAVCLSASYQFNDGGFAPQPASKFRILQFSDEFCIFELFKFWIPLFSMFKVKKVFSPDQTPSPKFVPLQNVRLGLCVEPTTWHVLAQSYWPLRLGNWWFWAGFTQGPSGKQMKKNHPDFSVDF